MELGQARRLILLLEGMVGIGRICLLFWHGIPNNFYRFSGRESWRLYLLGLFWSPIKNFTSLRSRAAGVTDSAFLYRV